MMNFEEKLKKAIKNKGFTIEEFAEKMGVSRQTVNDYPKRKTIDPAIIEKMCKLLGVDKDYFSESITSKFDTNVNYKGNIVHVPLAAQGGFLTGYANKVFMDTLQHYELPGVFGPHVSFEIQGMSMFTEGDDLSAKPGDWAICSEVEQLAWMMKQRGYILVTVDGILYKIFDKLDAEKKVVHFHSLNKDYDGLEIPMKSIKRVYFVTRILKKI